MLLTCAAVDFDLKLADLKINGYIIALVPLSLRF